MSLFLLIPPFSSSNTQLPGSFPPTILSIKRSNQGDLVGGTTGSYCLNLSLKSLYIVILIINILILLSIILCHYISTIYFRYATDFELLSVVSRPEEKKILIVVMLLLWQSTSVLLQLPRKRAELASQEQAVHLLFPPCFTVTAVTEMAMCLPVVYQECVDLALLIISLSFTLVLT